jgi:hypothetical protein
MLLSPFGISLKHVSSCVNLVLVQKLAEIINFYLIFQMNNILEFLEETDVAV